jgi:hypothetical protein
VETLLDAITPITIRILQYQYAGETEDWAAFKTRYRKSYLPLSILESIWTEIDTRHRLVRLVALLDDAIAFVVAAAG